MILKDKKILITGILTKQSIAYQIARKVQELGGEIILTGGPGRSLRLTEKTSQSLNPVPPVIPMDVTDIKQIQDAADDIRERWGTFDGLLHSIAYAPPSCLGPDFSTASWEDVSVAFRISAYSLSAMSSAFAPIMQNGSIVAMDFDASLVWTYYNWMGVCKSALESISRYLAKDLGLKYNIRVNCIASGPLRTVAAKAIPEFASFEALWNERSILKWDVNEDGISVAEAAAFLFSDMSKKITGEIIHVDGGFHIMGTPVERKNQMDI